MENPKWEVQVDPGRRWMCLYKGDERDTCHHGKWDVSWRPLCQYPYCNTVHSLAWCHLQGLSLAEWYLHCFQLKGVMNKAARTITFIFLHEHKSFFFRGCWETVHRMRIIFYNYKWTYNYHKITSITFQQVCVIYNFVTKTSRRLDKLMKI